VRLLERDVATGVEGRNSTASGVVTVSVVWKVGGEVTGA